MNRMFYQAIGFNAPIQHWNVEAVTDLALIFNGATKFDQPIGQWNIINIVKPGSLEGVLDSTNNALSPCNKRLIADAWTSNAVFKVTPVKDTPPSTEPYTIVWAAEKCPPLTDAKFKQAAWEWVHLESRVAAAKWGDIQGWDTSGVTSFANAFAESRNEAGVLVTPPANLKVAVFNADLGKWSTTSATDMRSMFTGSTAFNGDVSGFSTSKVTGDGFEAMFDKCTSFNGVVDHWETGNVGSLKNMFSSTSFNGDLNRWDVRNVKTMQSMFDGNTHFNQNLNKWSTGVLGSLSQAFHGASAFEGDGLSFWDVQSVTESTYFNAAEGNRAFRGAGLTDCNKRKIADVWSSESAFNNVTHSLVLMSMK
jgi:hypothetical protein